MHYYNDSDPYCAAWLRQLISAGLIPPGVVDSRSITEVLPGKPDLVVAFPGGHGTADMVQRARAAGVPVWEPPTVAPPPC